MFSHVFVGVSDFERALAFYEPLMAALGIPPRFVDRGRPWAGWQTPGGPRPLFLVGTPYDGNPHAPGNGQMVAFLANDRATVRRACEVALAHGGTSEGAPGLRPAYHADYYGAYFRDPDGNKLCVVCHLSQDPQGCSAPSRPAAATASAGPATEPASHGLVIRDETLADVEAIGRVTTAAFAPLEISRHTEACVIEALRAAHALAVSLVAEVDGEVVGHVAFSPVSMSDGTPGWYGLGPVSVAPAHQRRGVGGALIREGLSRLKATNARGCCLVGHPGYYRRFGFENPRGLEVEGVAPEVFFALSFDGHTPRGTVRFNDGFGADARRAAP